MKNLLCAAVVALIAGTQATHISEEIHPYWQQEKETTKVVPEYYAERDVGPVQDKPVDGLNESWTKDKIAKIRQVLVYHDHEYIRGFSTVYPFDHWYDQNENLRYDSSTVIEGFELVSDDEYLVSVGGTFSPFMATSLTFKTNKGNVFTYGNTTYPYEYQECDTSAAMFPFVYGVVGADLPDQNYISTIYCNYVDLAKFYPEYWTDKYYTTQKLGNYYAKTEEFDDIEILKSTVPLMLPKIQSIEVSYGDYIRGYKINYSNGEIETNYHQTTDDIQNLHNDVFVLDEDDYIIEMGGNIAYAIDSLWFKTKNGIEAQYGFDHLDNWSYCRMWEASRPMIIGFGMSDHLEPNNWPTMQSLWCHYVDLDDF